MYDFIDKNQLIYEQQFGFQTKYSINHAIISTTEAIKSQIDNGNYVEGVFIGLKKLLIQYTMIFCVKNLHSIL